MKKICASLLCATLAVSLVIPSGVQASETEEISGWTVTYYSATEEKTNLGQAPVFVTNTYTNSGLDTSRIKELEGDSWATAAKNTSVTVADPFGYIMSKTAESLASKDDLSSLSTSATNDEKMKLYPLLQKVKEQDVSENNLGIYLAPSGTTAEKNKKAVISSFTVQDGMDVVISPTTTSDNRQVDVTGKISVESGGRLAMMSENPAVSGTVTFDEPIEVNNGGLLVFDTGAPVGSSVNYAPIKYTAGSDNPIATINEGGKAYFNVGTLNLPDNAQSAAIKVNGGEVTINPGSVRAGAAQDMFNVFDLSLEKDTWTSPETLGIASASTSTNVPLVEVTTGELTVRGGQFASNGSESAIKATGGTVTLEDGSVTSSADGVSAISVGAGATVVIPETSTTEVTATANGNNQAISLDAGAKVQMAEKTATVGATGSYIDNDGIAVLSAGATTETSNGTRTLKTAIMGKDGTIYEGSGSDAPKYEITETGLKVTIPDGGAVIEGNTVTDMPYGGSVSGDGQVSVTVKSLNLDRDSVFLYHNTDNNTVQLKAFVDPDTVPVTWSSDNEGVATVDQDGLVTAHSNGTAKITAKAGGEEATCTVTVSTYTYTGDYNYPVTIGKTEHGTVTIAKEDQWANDGEKITVTVTPDDAYMLDKLVIKDKAGNELQVKDNGDGTYTFTMPEGAVTITATFVEDPDWVEPEPEPEPSTDVTDIFNDVTPGAWYVDVVQYAYDHGLMTGTSATTFEPDTTTSRAMIVSILHRLEGSPSVGTCDFSDVASGAWYADPVAWAAENGIVAGFENGTFGPNDPITREQMASILYRYAEYKGIDTSARADLSAYSDQPSAWAQDVMEWANAEGLINGTTTTTLDPQGTATRAQVAAMLQRFIENVL